MDFEHGHPYSDSPDLELLVLPPTSLNDKQMHEEPHVSLLRDDENTDDSEKSTSTNSPNSVQKQPILPSLIWAIGCLNLATVSLLGFILLLRAYDKKESPSWSLGVIGFTFNTIISTVSTVFKTSLLMPVAQSISQLCWTWYVKPRSLVDICYYDSASRGPLGSVHLLLRLRFMYLASILFLTRILLNSRRHFASIGAIITIAALGLDPAFQQTVKYSSQSAIDPSSQAKATAAHFYSINMTFQGPETACK